MGIDQERPAGSEADIDRLFAREPDGVVKPAPAPPALIFTEPADSHEHQFADEAALFTEERGVSASEAAPLDADARWTSAQAPADLMLRFFQVAAALVVFVGALFLFLMPDGRRPDGPREPAVPRRLSIPESRTASAPPPAVATAPTAASTPAPEEAAPAGAARAILPVHDVSSPGTPAASARAIEPAAGQTTARRPVSTTPPVSIAAAADPSLSAPARTETTSAIPRLEVDRLPTDSGSIIGAPVPAARVPAENGPRPAAPEIRAPAPAVASTPTGTSGVAVVDPRSVEQGKVRAILSRYEAAYSDLDAGAAARVYPSIDRKALSRAFDALASQQILFEDCRIQVANATARATCAGTASWTPKVGTGFRQQARRWQFDLKQVSGAWQIGNVQIE